MSDNSNGETKDLKIQTIGYDLEAKDFVSEIKLKKQKYFEFKQGNDIFIDALKTYKLMTIRGKRFEKKVPSSQLLTKLEGDLLAKGKYVVELQDLGTGEKRYCRVKIR